MTVPYPQYTEALIDRRHGPSDGAIALKHQPHREPSDDDFGSAMYAALRRKEVSVPWRDTSLPHLLCFGSVLYVAEQLLMYPSDLVKTRLQIDTRPGTKLWRETSVLFRHILKREGPRGLFRGFAFGTFGGIPPQLVFLVTYNSCKEKVEQVGGQRCHDLGIAPLIAGAAAEAVTAVFWVPIDIIVQRLQIQGGLPPGWAQNNAFVKRWATPTDGKPRRALDVIRQILRQDGPFGLWRGLGAHMSFFIPQTGIWWASYEQSKHVIDRAMPEDGKGVPVHIAAGMSAGAITAAVTTPELNGAR